jgi:hypothetical protein
MAEAMVLQPFFIGQRETIFSGALSSVLDYAQKNAL